jgi:hypothetical protein
MAVPSRETALCCSIRWLAELNRAGDVLIGSTRPAALSIRYKVGGVRKSATVISARSLRSSDDPSLSVAFAGKSIALWLQASPVGVSTAARPRTLSR